MTIGYTCGTSVATKSFVKRAKSEIVFLQLIGQRGKKSSSTIIQNRSTANDEYFVYCEYNIVTCNT